MLKRSVLLIACLLAFASPAYAQGQPDEIQVRIRALEEQIRALQAQLTALLAAQTVPQTVAAPVAPTTPPPEPPPPPAAPQNSATAFNPAIGIIGNLVGGMGQSRGGSPAIAPTPLFTLQESELSLQAIADPYARADFFLAIGEEGIEVEEGYVTFNVLPGGFLVKAGKMRANMGRLNAYHNHTLPWVDRPLVMFNLLGGSPNDPDTGIKDAGLSVARLIPAGKVFMEATAEIFRGDSGTIFKSSRRGDFSTVEHLRTYVDLSEATNLEVGGSYARGHNDLGSQFVTQLFSTDVLLRWKPPTRAIYRSFAARTELFWSRREQPTSLQKAFGGYAAVDYGFRRRWLAGGRYDWSDRAASANLRDKGASAVLTFQPSEFTQVRGQYRWTLYGDNPRAAHEFLVQALFTIGAHGAHAF